MDEQRSIEVSRAQFHNRLAHFVISPFDFSAKTLTKIETHLDTNNATEAWILLAMVAPNIKGHNPERVSKLLLQNLKYDMTNTVENCYIQLEVLSFWLKYLNNPSKNEIKRLMTEMLTTGSLLPRNINRAFGICYTLSTKSGDRDRQQFIAEIREACEAYILTNRNSMFVPNLCDDRLISYLYLYSEIGSIPDLALHEEIMEFFFIFLRTAAEGQLLTGKLAALRTPFLSMKLIPSRFVSDFSAKRFNAL